MENHALISVIIPVYNVEKYLHECVDSVLGQTYKNLEIILVDDGSTDSSGKICDEYAEKDSRIVVIHKKNDGPSKTRNAGLNRASGKYIYFLDSDDFITENAMETLVSAAESDSADLVFFDAFSFSDDGSQVKQGYTVKGTYTPKSGYEILTELHKNKDYHCAIYLLFIRHSLLADNNISFLESAYCSEDMLFTYQVYCSAEKAVQCKNTMYHRRYRSGSIVTSKKQSGISAAAVMFMRKLELIPKKSAKQAIIWQRNIPFAVPTTHLIFTKSFQRTIKSFAKMNTKI